MPLDHAHEHLSRLHSWGFSCLRFLVTWEAIEHGGPGVYDEEYLTYIREVLLIAQEYGFSIYIDPHQDAWSRYTGGSGAPAWALEVVGFDLTALTETGCAMTHQGFEGPKKDYPKMIWPTNYTKLACATMFTLFYGGNKYAPGFEIEGVPVQDYLQDHYIGAICALASRIKDLECLVGFGTMNETSPGYIGVKDLESLFSNLRRGFSPTPLQSMALGMGHSVLVKHLNKAGMGNGSKVLNPKGIKVWRDGRTCPWMQQGVWAEREGGTTLCSSKQSKEKFVCLKPDYFADGDFGREFYLPFAQRFTARVRAACGRASTDVYPAVFLELPPHDLGVCSFPSILPEEVPGAVNGVHWYDNMTLYLGNFYKFVSMDVQTMRPKVGSGNVRKMFVSQLAEMKLQSVEKLGGVPTLIGEVGIPFNLNQGKAYQTRDWSTQVEAMDTSMFALEANLLNFTLWCYCPSHTPELGDAWNLEDLSIFSNTERSNTADINSGGRALEAVVRPFAFAVAGQPTAMFFKKKRGFFHLEFSSESPAEEGLSGCTEIYVPLLHYPVGFLVEVSDGTWELKEYDKHGKAKLVVYRHSVSGQHTVNIFDPRKPREDAAGGGSALTRAITRASSKALSS